MPSSRLLLLPLAALLSAPSPGACAEAGGPAPGPVTTLMAASGKDFEVDTETRLKRVR